MDDTPSDFPFEPTPKRKRGGRKAGSKNKPKPKSDGTELLCRITELECRIARMNEAVHGCCVLLEKAMSLRIGMMDSESRAHDIAKQRSQLEQQAHDQLRGML